MTLFDIPVALTKKILRASVRTARGLIRPLRADTGRLLFVFGGRTSYWAGMGRDLYEQEPAFRASVQETCQLIHQIAGEELLANFEGPLDENFFADRNKVIFGIMTVQIALADLWSAKGIVPDATLGVSLGEAVAVYAAGGLTRTDVVRICTIWHKVGLNKAKEFISIHIEASLTDAQAICQACPVFLTVIYEAGPGSVLAFYRRPDKPLLRAFMDEQQVTWQQAYPDTSWPFHTPLFTPDRHAIEQCLKAISPQPLRRDYYSPTLGRRLPAHTFVPAWLWHELICSPVLLYTTFKALQADQYRVITQVGPHPFLTTGTQKDAFDVGQAFLLLDSMRYQTPELPLFRATHRQLRRLNWKKMLGRRNDKRNHTDAVTAFVQHLNLSAPSVIENPCPVYTYLRGQYRLCYLPVHQAWLVLTYDDINDVLQQPNLFSSQVHQNFDSFLIGADPPGHTLVRAMLQPLFSPQATTNVAAYVIEAVQQRIDTLFKRPHFDVVADLALPLAQSVMAHFLGLTPDQTVRLQAGLTGHPYDMGYLDELVQFFTEWLEQLPDQPGDRAGPLLMAHVRSRQLSFDGAVSLMKLLWVAGTTTTSILVSSGINALLRRPDLTEQLLDNEALIPKFVEECLRQEPPEPTVWRLTTQDTVLAGQALPAGSLVILAIQSANRDPDVFSDPDEWLLTRPAKRHFTFGAGFHHCIGANIARLEAQAVVRALLTRLPTLRAVEAGPPVYHPSAHLRGLDRLLVSQVSSNSVIG